MTSEKERRESRHKFQWNFPTELLHSQTRVEILFKKRRTIKTNFLHFSSSLIPESDGLQRFSEQPRYTEVNPGQDALLVCKIIDKRGTCSWQKDNKPVGMYAKKYEWASSPMGNQQTSNSGDCSIWIRAATLEFDDGFWECQVTASDFTAQDALTSQPVRLVVRGKQLSWQLSIAKEGLSQQLIFHSHSPNIELIRINNYKF